MRRAVRETFMREMWLKIREAPPATLAARTRCCPSCRQPMRIAAVRGLDATPIEMDVCPNCQMIWLDPDEVDALPRLPSLEPDLSPEARQKMAMIEVALLRARLTRETDTSPPGSAWQIIATLFGLPVEENAPPRLRPPAVTLVLAVLIVCGFGLSLGPAAEAVTGWGLLPNEPLRHGGLDWLTSFFLHGGVIHFIVNLYFLLIFGGNIEDLLGPVRYLGLLAAGHLVAGATHIVFDSRGAIPLVGASGGLSAVIAFYACALPRVRLVFSLFGWIGWWALLRPGGGYWFRLSARWAFALWLLLQGFGAWLQWQGFSTVSAIAHLGGAAAGAGLWWCWRQRLPITTVTESDWFRPRPSSPGDREDSHGLKSAP
jgi:membrane associated rhomboid family serine protease